MNDLIDRKALGIGYANPDVFEQTAYAQGWNSAVKLVLEAPTVDAVPTRWIRAEDAVPGDDERVLVLANGKHKRTELHNAYELATYHGEDGWELETYPWFDDVQVSYWMSLPPAP